MTLRYPEVFQHRYSQRDIDVLIIQSLYKDPTPEEREAFDAYFYLFSRLYPCGECAAEFQMLLRKFPPQTSSRRSASLWYTTFSALLSGKAHPRSIQAMHRPQRSQ